ncbi:MAG: hypothetical protein ACK56F_30725, partial [bacterium]
VPLHARTQLPDHIHPAIGTQHHALVLDRGDFGGQHRHDAHLLVVRDEPFHHARLDVLEDVRGIPVHGIRFAVVADDQEVVARHGLPRGVTTPAAASAGRQCADEEGGALHHPSVGCSHHSSASSSLAASSTGIEPRLSNAS